MQSIMILLTYMISSVAFPSLIVYGGLPGTFFIRTDAKNCHIAFAWTGCINVGTFFCWMAAGVWCSLKFCHPSKKDFSKIFWFLVILMEIVFSSVIACSAILKNKKPTYSETAGMLAIFSLAFFHGFTSSYFNVWRAPISKINQNQKA